MHIHAETKGHACGMESCTKAFKRRRELQAHRKTHETHETHEASSPGGNREMDDEDEEMGEGSSSPGPDIGHRIGIPPLPRSDGPSELPKLEQAPREELTFVAVPLDKALRDGRTLPQGGTVRSGLSALSCISPSRPPSASKPLNFPCRPTIEARHKVDLNAPGMRTTLAQPRAPSPPERRMSQELRSDAEDEQG